MENNLTTYLKKLEKSTGAEFFIVGGYVRDGFLGLESSDIDLVARGLSHDSLIRELGSFGNVEVTGAVFGVIRFFPHDRDIPMLEISLPRKEISLGFGHKDFKVEFDHALPIHEDLARRDFTVNAMAIKVSNSRLHGHPKAQKDLEDKVLRVLHPDSAKEDPLRILRAIRFISKLGFSVETSTDEALREAVPLLEHVSAERLQDELLKIVMGPYVDVALSYAQEIGALKVILPELDYAVGVGQNDHHVYDVFNHTLQVTKFTDTADPYVKLAALFHDIAKPVVKWAGEDGIPHFYGPEPGQEFSLEPEVYGNHEDVGADMTYKIMTRLRFSESHTNRVAALVKHHMFIQGENLRSKAARKLLAKLYGMPGSIEDNVEALFAIRYGDILGGKANGNISYTEQNKKFYAVVVNELEKKSVFSTRDLAVNGRDIMELGVPEGPEIGRILKALLSEVIDDPEKNRREYLLGEAKTL